MHSILTEPSFRFVDMEMVERILFYYAISFWSFDNLLFHFVPNTLLTSLCTHKHMKWGACHATGMLQHSKTRRMCIYGKMNGNLFTLIKYSTFYWPFSRTDHHNIYIRRTDHKIVHSEKYICSRNVRSFTNFIVICKFNFTVKCFMLFE